MYSKYTWIGGEREERRGVEGEKGSSGRGLRGGDMYSKYTSMCWRLTSHGR